MLFPITVGFKIKSNVTITTSYMYNVYGLQLQPWREMQVICLTHGQCGFGGSFIFLNTQFLDLFLKFLLPAEFHVDNFNNRE